MTLTRSTARGTPLAARRIGYLLAALINAGILFALNVVPGWDVLPFLSTDTERVLPVVNLSLAVGIVANLAYVAYDSGWYRSLGDLITAAVGLAALARIWVVFPFDFASYSFNWGLVTRAVLVVAIADPPSAPWCTLSASCARRRGAAADRVPIARARPHHVSSRQSRPAGPARRSP